MLVMFSKSLYISTVWVMMVGSPLTRIYREASCSSQNNTLAFETLHESESILPLPQCQ